MELIHIENNAAVLDVNVSKEIAEFESAIKELKKKEDDLKASILSEMESKGIIRIETDDILITYIAPGERETLDSKALRENHPDLYDDYVKFSPVKSSIRLKVK